MGVVQVERLFGVIESLSISLGPFGTSVALKPSKELLGEIKKLPKGTKIGIERFSPQEKKKLDRFRVRGVRVEPSGASKEYWGEIEEACRLNRLDITYLDDVELWKDFARYNVRATAERLGSLRDSTEKSLRRNYAYGTEGNYIYVCGRELPFLERIRKSGVRIAIIGRGHSEYFWNNPEFPLTYGVKFKSYGAESSPDPNHLRGKFEELISYEGATEKEVSEALRKELPQNQLEYNPKIDQQILWEHISAERRYRALKENRVTNEKEPDFIGTWDTAIPAKGLFEMFVSETNGQSITGTIEDTLGTSTFDGVLKGEIFTFDKEYDEEAHLQGTLTGKISYQSVRDGNKFKGKFEHEKRKRDFEIEPVSKRAKALIAVEA